MIEEEGPYFEDLDIGMKFKSKIGRTLTDVDNIWFTLLTNNTNQIHFNKDYTERYYAGEPFKGKLVVNGILTLAIAIGLTVEFTSARGFMLGIENVKFLNPVFSGDTLYAEAEIIEKRESKSRPNFGIIKIKTIAYNQENKKVLEFDRVIMIPKKGALWTGTQIS
jgi:acyl dehydratase